MSVVVPLFLILFGLASQHLILSRLAPRLAGRALIVGRSSFPVGRVLTERLSGGRLFMGGRDRSRAEWHGGPPDPPRIQTPDWQFALPRLCYTCIATEEDHAMIAVRLPPAVERRLERLANRTGR